MRASRRLAGLLASTVTAALLVPLGSAPALAAPPDNDEVEGAVPISVGDRVVQDTTEATTNAGDAALNEDCGAPETNASVWYSFTPARDRRVVIDMRRSDYSGGVLVFEDAATPESIVTCGPGRVPLEAEGGRTYLLMVISDTDVNGGQLVLSLTKAPRPPRVRVTLADRGVAYRGGAARIHGRYKCSRSPDGDFLGGRMMQRAGRLKIPASFGRGVRCDGEWRRWSVRVVSRTGIYDRGPARVRVRLIACGVFECAVDRKRDTVRLRRAYSRGGTDRAEVTASSPRQVPELAPEPTALVERTRWSRG